MELGKALKPKKAEKTAPIIEEGTKPLQEITNPIDVKATPEEKLNQIHALTAVKKPILDAQLKELDAEIGTKSNANTKEDKTILEKAKRPIILVFPV